MDPVGHFASDEGVMYEGLGARGSLCSGGNCLITGNTKWNSKVLREFSTYLEKGNIM
jgi:hypothetical protein